MKSDKITGSRDADGNVWIVNWNDSKMKVNRNNPDNHNDNWRPRQEVSKKKSRDNRDFLMKNIMRLLLT